MTRFVGILASSLLLASPATGQASTPPLAAVAPAGDLDEARRLYNEGRNKYETADYEDALELWKQSYALLPQDGTGQEIRAALVYNMSEAHTKAYEISRDVTHLRKAKLLLENYLKEHTRLHGNSAEAVEERKSAQTRLAEIDAMLREAEQAAPAPTPAPAPVAQPQAAPQPAPPPDPVTSAKLARMREIREDPDLYRQYQASKGMFIGGIVTLSVGAGVLLFVTLPASAAGLGESVVDEATGDTNNRSRNVAIASGVIGGALIIGGGALTIVGATRKKKLQDAPPGTGVGGAQARIAPWASPQGAGGTLHLRF